MKNINKKILIPIIIGIVVVIALIVGLILHNNKTSKKDKVATEETTEIDNLTTYVEENGIFKVNDKTQLFEIPDKWINKNEAGQFQASSFYMNVIPLDDAVIYSPESEHMFAQNHKLDDGSTFATEFYKGFLYDIYYDNKNAAIDINDIKLEPEGDKYKISDKEWTLIEQTETACEFRYMLPTKQPDDFVDLIVYYNFNNENTTPQDIVDAINKVMKLEMAYDENEDYYDPETDLPYIVQQKLGLIDDETSDETNKSDTESDESTETTSEDTTSSEE